jgi:hypothetical protein
MKISRKQFLLTITGALVASGGIGKTEQSKPVFNVKLLKERLEYLKKHPAEARPWRSFEQGKIRFVDGKFSTDDDELIRSLFNHPHCKK